MTVDVVVFPRRSRMFLARVTGREERADGTVLSVTAEDGARFRLPSARVLVEVTSPLEPGADESDADLLRRVRDSVEPFSAWLPLHGRLEEERTYTTRELAAAWAEADDEPADGDSAARLLGLALGASGAAPWFRRRDDRFTVVPSRRAVERLFEMARERFTTCGNEAVARWWPSREETGLPHAWTGGPAKDAAEFALERSKWFDPRYAPDADLAGSVALRDLTMYALAGEGDEVRRGAALARSLSTEDPDVLLEALAHCGAVDERVDPSAFRAGLAAGPSPSIVQLAREWTAGDAAPSERLDLTDWFTVAVDAAGTSEVDDALSIRAEGDRIVIGVHVADTCARPWRIELEGWARERATSLYTPDGSVAMLPQPLVDALSLGPAPRPAISVIAELDERLTVVSTRIERSLVSVDRHATYAESEDAAVLAETPALGERWVAVAEALRSVRAERGARLTRTPTTDVELTGGEPRIVMRLQDTPGDLVVSEAMIFHNCAVAARLAEAEAPALFRTQGPPRDRPPRPDDPLYSIRLRRTFPPTRVLTEPAPHTGLGVPAYVRATSPIRRYGDHAMQLQLCAVLAAGDPPFSHFDCEELAAHLALREKRVRQAAELRLRYWVARAIAGREGETVAAVVSRLPRRGVGAVFLPELARELTLRVPKGVPVPDVGREANFRISRVRPWRGRIEVEPVVPDSGNAV